MEQAKRGRPRSETSRRAILEAVRDLVGETGYDSMSIEAVATRAGASRQTLYRWWPSRSSLVAEAVLEGYLQFPSVPVPHTSELRTDLRSWIVSASAAFNAHDAIRVVRSLMAAAADDARIADQLYRRVTEPIYDNLLARIEVGRAAPRLAQSAPPRAVADALIGALLLSIVSGQNDSARLVAVAEAVVPAAPSFPP